jgi:hypothetical protein
VTSNNQTELRRIASGCRRSIRTELISHGRGDVTDGTGEPTARSFGYSLGGKDNHTAGQAAAEEIG